MNPSLNITPATHADLPALCDLLGWLFAQEAEFKPDPETQARGLAQIIDNPAIGVVWVARHADSVVGMANLLFTMSTALGGKVAILEDMVVSPQARGLGVGSALLSHAIGCARAKNCLRITLLTDADNLTAQQFYQKQGFVMSGMSVMRLGLA